MSGWVAGAIVVGAVVSAGASAYSSNQASKSASKGRALQAQGMMNEAQINRARLEFEMEAYDENLARQAEEKAEWEETFGGIQDNLSDYYTTLDPDDYAAKNIQQTQHAYQEYQGKIDEQLAQRGIDQSGLAADLVSELSYENEMNKAQAGSNAEAQVRQEQASFLGMGVGGGNSGATSTAGVSNAYGAQAGAARGMQQFGQNQYNEGMARKAQADASFGQAIGTIGSGIGQYAQSSVASNAARNALVTQGATQGVATAQAVGGYGSYQ